MHGIFLTGAMKRDKGTKIFYFPGWTAFVHAFTVVLTHGKNSRRWIERERIEAAQLRHCLAEYHARKGHWDKAAKFWEIVTSNETLSQNAVIGIVELHVASALGAIQHGFRLIQEFNKNFDPEAESSGPAMTRRFSRTRRRSFGDCGKFLNGSCRTSDRRSWG